MQVLKFLLVKPKVAVCKDLVLDLLHHLGRKMHIRIPAFERPGRLIVAELMVDRLSHGEFVKVGLQKGIDNSVEFHREILLNDIFRQIL
jgi:hypothetical protein